eukprot:TRINITY_DN51481_c0_g1_i1.p1 TRINITY_DN51481_c0_g1~~TRINITY_DN51481_c0_g1_i1.p1  ORF type:complete len:197 (+),score=14.16 TRINITY_DN51481_c0_g1_i1:239-829(+)
MIAMNIGALFRTSSVRAMGLNAGHRFQHYRDGPKNNPGLPSAAEARGPRATAQSGANWRVRNWGGHSASIQAWRWSNYTMFNFRNPDVPTLTTGGTFSMKNFGNFGGRHFTTSYPWRRETAVGFGGLGWTRKHRGGYYYVLRARSVAYIRAMKRFNRLKYEKWLKIKQRDEELEARLAANPYDWRKRTWKPEFMAH